MAKNRDRKVRKKREREQQAREHAKERSTIQSYISDSKQKSGLSGTRILHLLRESARVKSVVFAHLFTTPAFRKRYIPLPFPTNYTTLGKAGVDSPSKLEDCLRLAFEILKQCSSQITLFVSRRTEFAGHMLRGSLKEAEKTLHVLRGELGLSVWMIEAELLLKEYQLGLDGNRSFAAEVTEQVEDGLIKFYISYLTQRVESTLSVHAYEAALTESIPDEKDIDDRVAPIISEVMFRLSYHRNFDVKHLDFLLVAARSYSVCDLYLTYLRILETGAARSDCQIDHTLLLWLIEQSASSFADPRFPVLLSCLHPESLKQVDKLQDCLFETAHLYTQGNYEKTIAQSFELLQEFPACIDLYEFVARSTITSKADLPILFSESSLGDEILQLMYATLSRSGGTQQAVDRLLKISYAVDCTGIGNRLLAFTLYQTHQNHHCGTHKLRAISSSRATPWSCTAYSDRNHAFRYLSACDRVSPANLSVALYRSVLANSSDDETLLSTIPPYRRLKYQAKSQELQKNYTRAADLYRSLWEISDGRGNLVHEATCGLFRNLTRSESYAAAANVIVDTFLARPDVLIGELTVGVEALMRSFPGSLKDDSYIKNATGPLLIYLAQTLRAAEFDNYTTFVAYDDCLRAHDARRPTHLLNGDFQIERHRLLAFLRYVCVPQIMRRSYQIQGTDALENERLAILQYLLVHEPQRKSETESEIAALTKLAAVREALKQVESSRIYVNTEGIRQSLLVKHAEKFDRYKRMLELHDESLRRQLRQFDFMEKTLIYSDVGHQLFEELFFDIRDLFVSSKADGLDTYLSMRIRHGTLAAQFRGEFEQLHLITRYLEADGVYARNEYWTEQFRNLGFKAVAQIDDILRQLSQTVDDLINELNRKWIRISTSPKEQFAMFNYHFSVDDTTELYVALSETTDYTEFVDNCFQALWKRTEKLLDKVRDRLYDEFLPKLTQAITKAESEVNLISSEIRESDFPDRIAACRTGIQNATKRVAEWFTASSLNIVEAFDFHLLVETATLIVQRVHKDVVFHPVSKIETLYKLDGKWFNAFVDVMNILLDNVVRHSAAADVECKILIQHDAEIITILVENSLGEDIDRADRLVRVRELLSPFIGEPSATKLQTEGGSGFGKLHKLLKQDLKLTKAQVSCDIANTGVFRLSITIPDTHLQAEIR